MLFLDDMTEEDLFGSVFATKLLQDPDFVQKVGAQALEDLVRHSEVSIPTKQPLSLVYGTADGRIGTLFQVPPLVHRVMQMLQKAMDSSTNQDLVQFKRSDYRQVKSSVSTVAELAMNLENSPD